jgi:hypothetical protein
MYCLYRSGPKSMLCKSTVVVVVVVAAAVVVVAVVATAAAVFFITSFSHILLLPFVLPQYTSNNIKKYFCFYENYLYPYSFKYELSSEC